MAQTALVIDDNSLNLETLALLLKKEGMTPITVQYVKDIPQAVAKAGDLRVVFLDLEFPNQHGYNILAELKQDKRLQGIPFVAYTVHISELNEARDAGFDSFIGKPLSPEHFPDQLARILQGERVWEV